MSKDRLKDLQKDHLNHEDQNEPQDVNSHSTTINITTDTESNVADFLKQTDLIRSFISRLDALVQEVKRIHVEMLKPMTNPRLEQELDAKNEDIKKIAYDISTKLKKMEQAQENDKTANAQWRIRESQIFVLVRCFRDTMIQYNTETVSHRERCKKIIVREREIGK